MERKQPTHLTEITGILKSEVEPGDFQIEYTYTAIVLSTGAQAIPLTTVTLGGREFDFLINRMEERKIISQVPAIPLVGYKVWELSDVKQFPMLLRLSDSWTVDGDSIERALTSMDYTVMIVVNF